MILSYSDDLREIEPLMDSLTVPVRYVRLDENMGLTFCRRYGSQIATGDTVLILDSHIEVRAGFMEPLLEILDQNYKNIVAPVFDFWDTFNNKVWNFSLWAMAC